MKKYFEGSRNGNSRSNSYKRKPSALKTNLKYTVNAIAKNDIAYNDKDKESFVYDAFDALSEPIYENASVSLIDAITIPIQMKRSLISGVSTDRGVVTIGKLIGFDKDVTSHMEVLIYSNYVDTFNKVAPNAIQVNLKVFTSYVPDSDPEINYQITYLEAVVDNTETKEHPDDVDQVPDRVIYKDNDSNSSSFYNGLEDYM